MEDMPTQKDWESLPAATAPLHRNQAKPKAVARGAQGNRAELNGLRWIADSAALRGLLFALVGVDAPSRRAGASTPDSDHSCSAYAAQFLAAR